MTLGHGCAQVSELILSLFLLVTNLVNDSRHVVSDVDEENLGKLFCKLVATE